LSESKGRGRQQAASAVQEAYGALPAGRRLPQHSLSDLLIPFSLAVDLAEGKRRGHAQRVAYIALALAAKVGADPETRLDACYAGLFHDIGTIPAGAGLSGLTRGDERLVFASLPLLSPEEAALEARSSSPELVADRIVDHSVHGARAALDLALPSEAVRGISCHHERWDGTGYPHGLAKQAIPLAGRITALTDHMEAVISQEPSPLAARRNLPHWLARLAGGAADPELVAAAKSLASGDNFWLGLFSEDLAANIAGECGALRESRANRLLAFAERFAELMDSRFNFTAGVSGRVARLSESLGKSMGLPVHRLRLLRIAALLHDVGQLGVPESIMAKPAILTVEELEVLRQHPVHSSEILAGVPGLEEVAQWAAAHHERLDGRGYPEGRAEGQIPLEARILAIADAYVAITSDRPHRRRAEAEDGVRRLYGAAGSQLDAGLVRLFVERVIA
jgi:HD-GYP domain-containing protein (c-di-GMP phosphodiesterase class II)